mmetsp:Transcript_98071/g.184406  ORF Transcript_98071/g.184406 Transcript_98071/m.184406 type:complete len:191 (-) Transcript_98071:90-662(-)
MAFAASLARRTDSAQSSFAEEVNAKIHAFVQATMQQFESACAARADAGYSSCEFNSQKRVSNDLWKNGVHGSAKSALRALQSSIEQKMAGLGFSSMKVSPWMSQDSGGAYKYQFALSASWDGIAHHQAPPAALPQGMMSQCPICFEVKAFVALTPCGHTLCRDCAANVTGGPCPSCRRQVTGFTCGLFID